jgi:hypothetical protein
MYVFFRIYDPDYRAVGRRFIALKRKRSFLAAAPENKFADSGTDRIESDHRLALGSEIGVQCLHDQHLAPLERFILDRGNYVAYDSRQLHLLDLLLEVRDRRFDLIRVRGLRHQVEILLQFGGRVGVLFFLHIDAAQIFVRGCQAFAAL